MQQFLSHAGKPFPLSMYEFYDLKCRHFLIFWELCNNPDFINDDEGWVWVNVKQFETRILEAGYCPYKNGPAIVAGLKVLERRGYLIWETIRKTGTVTRELRVKIAEDAWEPKVVTKRPPQHRDRVEYMARRNALRKLLAKHASS
jgi:hypothetical protein